MNALSCGGCDLSQDLSLRSEERGAETRCYPLFKVKFFSAPLSIQ